MSTRAIILAAGRGSRLGPQNDHPKCLLRLGERTLLERQLTSLRLAGIDAVTVVGGFQADRVRAVCGGIAEVVENERFAETNSMYSLWLARAVLGEGFVVLNGDVFFHPQLLCDLLSARHEDALLVSFRDGDTDPFGDEEMKVKVRGGRVIDIAKTLVPADADGENVGIAKFSAAGARTLVQVMDDLVDRGRVREWAPRAFQAFAGVRPLHAVSTRGYPWIEIDFVEDYRRAVQEVLPLIEGHAGAGRQPSVTLVVPPEPESEHPSIAAPPPAAQTPADWRPQTGHV